MDSRQSQLCPLDHRHRTERNGLVGDVGWVLALFLRTKVGKDPSQLGKHFLMDTGAHNSQRFKPMCVPTEEGTRVLNCVLAEPVALQDIQSEKAFTHPANICQVLMCGGHLHQVLRIRK